MLDDRLIESFTIAEAAAELGANRSHLVRVFTMTFGIAPHPYVIGRRVDRARRLLLAGHSPPRRPWSQGFTIRLTSPAISGRPWARPREFSRRRAGHTTIVRPRSHLSPRWRACRLDKVRVSPLGTRPPLLKALSFAVCGGRGPRPRPGCPRRACGRARTVGSSAFPTPRRTRGRSARSTWTNRSRTAVTVRPG